MLAVALAMPARAYAEAAATDYRIGVLEFASGAREPAFARAFVERVRAYVQVQPGFLLCHVSGSLPELATVAACNPAELGCMRTLAERLNVDGVIFGTLEEAEDGPVAVMQRFDVASSEVTQSARAKFVAPTTRPDRLDPEVRRVVLELLGNADTAVGLVTAQPQAAEAPARAPLPAPPVERVERDSGSSVGRVAGYVLLGAAAVSAGFMVVSSVQVKDADDRTEYLRYREAVGREQPALTDVCEEAEAGRSYGVSESDLRAARDSCDQGSLFEVLQLVFLGGAVVSGGLGTYLLLSAGDDEQPQALRVSPLAAAGRIGLNAELSF